jgi:ABC-type glycerol-3-phosphate transport system permease component
MEKKEPIWMKLVVLAVMAACIFPLVWAFMDTAAEKDWTQGLPPCAMEDSDNCYWDADEMGNGQGRSFITVEGVTIYQD